MRNGLISAFQAKSAPKEDENTEAWDKINEEYEKFSAFMDQLFEFNSGFFSIISLYIQTFAVFKVKTSLLPSITAASIAITNEISEIYRALLKQAEAKTSFTAVGGDKDRLKKFLDTFSRSLCWFIGLTAYKLIKVKDDKDQEKKDKEKEKETQSDKM